MGEVIYNKIKYRQEQWEKLILDCQNSDLKAVKLSKFCLI